jgi:hypothetical protein
MTSGITPVAKRARAAAPAASNQKPSSQANAAVKIVTPSVATARTRVGDPERSAIRPHAVGATSATSGDIVTTTPTSVPLSPALSLR